VSLPALQLDDLTFDDLRELAVRRIPAASGGRWTHHEPVDAGITLLELFAFLLDQQLFVLDQVPDGLLHAVLALVGQAPLPTGVARTVVAVEPGTLDPFQRLPAGTALRPSSNAFDAMVFTTREPTLLAPVVELGVQSDGEDVTSSLVQRRPTRVLTRTGERGVLTLSLRLSRPIEAAHVGEPLAFALVLDDDAVAPEWSEAATDVPAPATFALRWSGVGPVAQWSDGTGGLRRSGLLRVAIPAAAVGQDRFTLELATDAADHAEPPTLSSVHAGAIIAHHLERHEIAAAPSGDAEHDRIRGGIARQIDAWLPISGQTLTLPETPMPVLETTPRLRMRRPDGEWLTWTAVQDLVPVGPAEPAFRVDRERGMLLFGDGYNGRIPAAATGFSLDLETGGGPEGNHAAGLDWQLRDALAARVRFRSAAPARGGREAESLAEARRRVAASLGERHRAVTAHDYVTLVETAPGLARHRAHVVAGLDPTFPCVHSPDSVTVFVVPRTAADTPTPRADAGALAVLRERLDEARMLTTRVFVRNPIFRPVSLALEIASTGTDARALVGRLRARLARYLHPSLGGPDGTGWAFGHALRPSELLRVGQEVLPPETRIERVAIRLEDQDAPAQDCTEVAIAPTELVHLSRLVVQSAPDSSTGVTL
jgi:hypothetical protein